MKKNKIERLICDKDFAYLEPWFYNNPFALRCCLGIGDGDLYIANAKKRAREIFNILFPNGADAIIFDHFIYDHSDCGDAEKNFFAEIEFDVEGIIDNRIKFELENLRFLFKMQAEYRHFSVKNLKVHDEYYDESAYRKKYQSAKKFYDEIFDFLKHFNIDEKIFKHLFDFQKNIIKKPYDTDIIIEGEYDFLTYFNAILDGKQAELEEKKIFSCFRVRPFENWEMYAKKVVWYGRKDSSCTYIKLAQSERSKSND